MLSLAVVFGCDLGITGADPTFGTDYALLQQNQYPLCRAYFQEIKSIPLPQEVAASQSVTLPGPQGKRIPLR